MKDITVRELMVPLREYATVKWDATLLEAISALKTAQAAFDETRYRHRSILVYDENNHIVGKLSQMDIIKALEPDYTSQVGKAHLSRFGLSADYVEKILLDNDFWNRPVDQLCAGASGHKVSDVMYSPSEGEYIQGDASLQEAVHNLILGHHHSLLVREGDDIVGILRLADVFALVCEAMEEIS